MGKFDDEFTGYHGFLSEPEADGTCREYGIFQVFWVDEMPYCAYEDGSGEEPEEDLGPGWYWVACFPGCMPDCEEPAGPFNTSREAFDDARA